MAARGTIKVTHTPFGGTVEAEEGDLVWVLFGTEMMMGEIDSFHRNGDGVFVTIDLTRRGFYEWDELLPLSDEELEELV